MSPTADTQAADAIRAHHVQLHEALRQRVSELRTAVESSRPHGDARHAVVDYLETELLPHAMAEEATLYAAGDTGLTAVLVRAMREEHKGLIARVGLLRAAREGVGAAGEATAILALFES
ncbi:MAG: hemerythrin domain-containing protein, partial [Candidatus Limnocylindrales bacterium]